MASNRRKGSSKVTAATAAAWWKWKVGDLVLAKVKGFPARPAYGVDTAGAEAAELGDKMLTDPFRGDRDALLCRSTELFHRV